MENVDFSMDFVAINLNKLPKLSLERKFSLTFNVFTLGPIAHATLITIYT